MTKRQRAKAVFPKKWLKSTGFVWMPEWLCWRINFCRLHFCLRTDGKEVGQWWVYFDSTYGGRVGGYKPITSKRQLLILLEAFGINYRRQLTKALTKVKSSKVTGKGE